ncbi:MAG: tetratricopeptide repeat protein [Prevotellaceae bacterium]|nr:tetratricopeptide repeat protein [Prevotellaceae bacterium]
MKNILYIIILTVSITCGCSTSEKDRILDKAESAINEHPDSAQAMLETLYPYSNLTQAQKARCGVLLASAKLRQNKSFSSDSLLDNSIAYFCQNNDSVEMFRAYQLKAYQSMWRGQQDSMVYYLQQSISMIDEKNKPQLYSLNMKLADIYCEPSSVKDYNKAISYLQKTFSYASTDEQKAYSLHQIGACYGFIGNNDSALAYIARAISLSLQNKEQSNYITYVLNYANTPDVDYGKAERYLKELPESSLGKLITLGYLNLNNRHISAARYYCNKADSLYRSNPGKYSINTYNSLRIINACVDYAMDKEVSASDGVSTNDSISQVISRNESLKIEIADNNLLLQKHIHESEIKTQQRIVFIVSIVFVGLILFFLYDRHNKKRYINLRKELDQSRIYQIELQAKASEEDKNIDLVDIWKKRTDICKDNFIRSGWMKKLQLLEGDGISHNGSFLPPTERNRFRKILFEEFTDLIIDIKASGSGVNMDDLCLCLFSFLKVNNTTISMCMGVSENAIRTRKSRLKEKLEPQMYQFIFGK